MAKRSEWWYPYIGLGKTLFMAKAKPVPAQRQPRAQGRRVRDIEDIVSPSPGLPFPVVAIRASAGGLAVVTALLKALPPQTGMPFVLIQHLVPNHESALAALLSKATTMPVVEVSHDLR